MTGVHLDIEAGAARGINHGAHGGQVAAREDVLPDEVRRRAVRRVPLIRLRNGLLTHARVRGPHHLLKATAACPAVRLPCNEMMSCMHCMHFQSMLTQIL